MYIHCVYVANIYVYMHMHTHSWMNSWLKSGIFGNVAKTREHFAIWNKPDIKSNTMLSPSSVESKTVDLLEGQRRVDTNG